jgi:hypothetical protein
LTKELKKKIEEEQSKLKTKEELNNVMKMKEEENKKMNTKLTNTNKQIFQVKKELEDQINKDKEERIELKLTLENEKTVLRNKLNKTYKQKKKRMKY